MSPRATGMACVVAMPVLTSSWNPAACDSCSWNRRSPRPATASTMTMPNAASRGTIRRWAGPRLPWTMTAPGALMASPREALRLAEAQVDGPHDGHRQGRDGSIDDRDEGEVGGAETGEPDRGGHRQDAQHEELVHGAEDQGRR